jgi:WD40 repeat protein
MGNDSSLRLYEIVALALGAEPASRPTLIERACGDDVALRDRVLRILATRERLGEFLETPAPARLDVLAPPGPPLPEGARVGRYHLLRVLASGGSGTVYEALQESPHRKVALKVMAAGLGSTGAVNRFREEAEILARLSHPGVAHVYEAGVHEAADTRLPWLAIEYVEGGRDLLASAARLGVRGRVELMARVCDAVHHGHQQGILHGDLKPSNLLVDATGWPKVIDFGVARVLGTDADAELAGTPPYMSPEQCTPGSAALDVRSDVYALGAVLYELLAGRRAHDVGDLPLPAALQAVREQDPRPIETVDRRLRGGLSAIVGKALARDREARYASAAALADDLRRYLAHRAVEAHRGGALYHVGRFVRRQPVAFAAIAAVVLVSAAGAIVSAQFAVQSARGRTEAEFQAYVANLAAASAALARYDVGEARHRLELAPGPLRGWEWRYFARGLDRSERTYTRPNVSFATGAASDDGERVIAANWGADLGVLVHSVDTGEAIASFGADGQRVDALDFAPKGDLVALGYSRGRVEIRGVTGEPCRNLPAHVGTVRAVDFDPTGDRLVSAGYDGVARISEVTTGRVLVEFHGHGGRFFSARFDPRGERVCAGDETGTLHIWRAADGSEELTLAAGGMNVEGVAWSPDGTRIAAVSFDGTVRLWDATDGRLLSQARGHDATGKSVAFAPDGSTFATAGRDRTVRIWSARDGSALVTLAGHEREVYGVAYVRPDLVASFSLDGTIKVWNTQPPPMVLRGHANAVTNIAFGPAGAPVSASLDGRVRVWDGLGRATEPLPRRPAITALAPDGAAAATARFGQVEVWRLPSGEAATRQGIDGRVTALSLARGGAWVAAGTRDGDVHLWPVDVPGERITWRAHDAGVTALLLHDGGEVLASGSATGEVRVWRRGANAPMASRRTHGQRVSALAFDPSGARLASGGADGTAAVCDARTLAPLAALEGHRGGVSALAFSPDGTRLASTAQDHKARLWDAATWRELVILLERDDMAGALAWSHDGSTLAVGCGYWGISGSIALLSDR